MSDRKHMEYCVRLGNPFIQRKLEQLDDIEQKQYISGPINYNERPINENMNMSFKDRLKNWNV